MHERLVENWLINVNEKTFQTPFCQMLTAEGYTVFHLSRHGSFEEGKDIIAANPEGFPCAFQLKGSKGKISQAEWATYVDQVTRLVEIPIAYPGIDKSQPHQAYWVTNGEIDEEVRVEIDRRNIGWKNRGYPELQVITKGALLTRLLAIHKNFWPGELREEKDLLELYLANGYGVVAKPKLATFVQNLLDRADAKKPEEMKRALVSASIFTSYGLAPFERATNIVALIDGWTIFLANVISYSEQHNLARKYWESIYNLVVLDIQKNLSDLCNELSRRNNLIAGNTLVDSPFYPGRVTWLVSYMALLGLWSKVKQDLVTDEQIVWLEKFIHEHSTGLNYWGDAAVPQILTTAWFKKLQGLEYATNRYIDDMIHIILDANENESSPGLPDPWHSLQEVVANTNAISDSFHRENFQGRSYVLKGLIELLVRHGWRGLIAEHWPKISKMHFAKFRTDTKADFARWHNEMGNLIVQIPKTPQSWKELSETAHQIDDDYIPITFTQNPVLLLLFVLVFPHRLTNDVMKILDVWTDEFIKQSNSMTAVTADFTSHASPE